MKLSALFLLAVFTVALPAQAWKPLITGEMGFSGGGADLPADDTGDFTVESSSTIYLLGGMAFRSESGYVVKGRIGWRYGKEEYEYYSSGADAGFIRSKEFPIDLMVGKQFGKHALNVGVNKQLSTSTLCEIGSRCNDRTNYSTPVSPAVEYQYFTHDYGYLTLRLTPGIEYTSERTDETYSGFLIEAGFGVMR